jgi:CRP/FNR family cyclic AMP-dependent transcriptional regulator
MQSLAPILEKIELFMGLRPEDLELIAGCAANVHYPAGTFAGHAGDEADRFWVIRKGKIALELFVPGRGAITIATMSEGDVVGFSWLLPPYRLQFDIHALTPTRALLFDGRCVRGKCATDSRFGYELLSRFSRIMAARIHATSLQLLDIYGEHPIEHE